MDRSSNKNVKNIQINDSVKHHLINVYTSFALWMLCISIGTISYMIFQSQGFAIAAGLISIWIGRKLISLPFKKEKQNKRLLLLLTFGYNAGFALGLISEFIYSVDSQFFVTIFLSIALIFLCFSLSALYAGEVGDVFVGGILISGFTVILLSFAVNFLFPNIYQFNLYAGTLAVCVYVYLNTRLILSRYSQGEEDYIWHSVALIWLIFDACTRCPNEIFSSAEPSKSRVRKKSSLKPNY